LSDRGHLLHDLTFATGTRN